MKKFSLLLILCIGINLYAEDTINVYRPEISDVIPPSPNAASLGRFGNNLISYYNGTADVNIPLYEIKFGNEKIPIFLRYNGSGVKVSEEASWVGLSWTLNAGGCIIRECFGGDDFQLTAGLGARYGYFFDNNLDLGLDYLNFNELIGTWQPSILWALYNDPQPDIFHFNFGTHSGSMFLQQNNPTAIVRNCKEYLKATFYVNNMSWLIIDGNGYKFYFGGSDASRDISTGCYQTYLGEYNISPFPDITLNQDINDLIRRSPFESVITAWYLDSIVAPNKDKIVFEYKSENISTIPLSEEEVKLSNPVIGSDIVTEIRQNSYTASRIKQIYLSKIIFPNGIINFNTTDRKDIKSENSNGKKAQKLESVMVSNSSNQIKKYIFNYIYLGEEEDPSTCRLLLEKLIEQSTDGQSQQYSFSYNMGYLPAKNSRQIDFWGYYNDSKAPKKFSKFKSPEINEGTLIPSFIKPADDIGPKIFYFGRDRNPNPETMQHGILEKITYPTGGYTQFIYEPHDFTNQFQICFTEQTVSNETKLIFNEDSIGHYSIDSCQLTDFEINDNDTYEKQLNLSLCSILFPTVFPLSTDPYVFNWGNVVIKKFDTKTNDYTIMVGDYSLPHMGSGTSAVNSVTSQQLITLSPGKYRMYIETYLDRLQPSYSTINGYHTNKFTVKAYVSSLDPKTTSIGGGLRIKEIYDVTSQGEVSYRKYNYKKNNVSTGVLLTTPVYHSKFAFDQMNTPKEVTYESPAIFSDICFWAKSSPFVPLERLFSTSIVDYSEVEELLGRNGENGKKVYSFYTEQQISASYNYLVYFYDKIFPNSTMAGLPFSIITYDKEGTIKERKSYTYSLHYVSPQPVRGLCLRQLFPDFENPASLWAKKGFSFSITFLRPSYPNVSLSTYDISSEWVELIADTTVTVFNQDQSKLTKINDYSYDNVNYQPTVITTCDSKNNMWENRMIYPTEISNPLFLKSMVNIPIEKSLYKNGIFLEKQRTTYSTKYFPYMLLPEYLYYKRGNSEEEKIIEYITYDSKGNNLFVTQNNSTQVCFLWNYNYNSNYPIAEIKNATYEQVKSALGIDPEQLAASSTPDMSKVNSLRTLLPNSLVTTYTYKPLVGMTSKTDPRGITTYYEYDSFNRLQFIKDKDGKILQSFEYNYKH